MRLLVVLPFLLLTGIGLSAQNRNDVTLRWSAERRLTWNDYAAQPDKSSPAAASTATYLGLEYHRDGDGLSFRVICSFSTTNSWGAHKTDYILAHEQGHFDLAEIAARRFYKSLSEYKFNERTYQKDLSSIYQQAMDDKDAIQNQYDRETNHSIDKPAQLAWLKKIDRMLSETVDYAEYH